MKLSRFLYVNKVKLDKNKGVLRMSKKIFAIILSFVMIFSSISILMDEKVFAIDGEGLEIYEDGVEEAKLISNDVNDLINFKFEAGKKYTIQVKGDLEVPVHGNNLKPIILNGDITIEGNGHKITGADGGEQGDRFINIIDGNINIKNLDFDGSDKYAGILSDNTDATHKPSLNISDCNFTNLNTKSTDELYSNSGGPAISVVNTDIEAKRVNVSDSTGSIYGGGFYIAVTNYDLSGGTYVLQECNFTNCKAGAGGGAIALSTFTGVTVSIGKEMKNTLYIKGCVIDGCKSDMIGGAMFLAERTKTIITDSAYIDSDSKKVEKRSEIRNCSSEERGAAIYFQYAKLKIQAGTIIKNCFDPGYGVICAQISHDTISDDNLKDLIIEDSIIQDCKTSAIDIKNGDFLIKNSKISGCGAGQLMVTVYCNGKAEVDGSVFEGNSSQYGSGTLYVENSYLDNSRLIINNSKFIGNKNAYGGAITCSDIKFEIKNSFILDNESSIGAGINFSGRRLTYDSLIENTIFSNNKAIEVKDEDGSSLVGDGDCRGGALFVNLGDTSTLTINGGEITNNNAAHFGGGIYIFDKYDNTELADKNQKLIINDDVKFGGNTAGYGYYNPPENYGDYKNFTHKTHSRPKRIVAKEDGEYKHVDSLLNNYDINYINNETSTVYDPNGGQGKLFVEEINTPYADGLVKEHTVKIKELKDTNISNGSKVLHGWSTEPDGKEPLYKPGQDVKLKGNLYLYAIWERPAPKPTEPNTLILTLDENHRGGEITNIEVEEGELIEPHLYIPRRRGYIFKGWSYDRDHLDEVKPGDRIYTNTTLYAIWKRAEIERVEEPVEIKGEDHKTYIFGYPDGSVRPNGSITRAEAAAMLARLLNIEAIGSAAKPQFTDTESSWYNKAINAVVFRGIMKGYPDGRFRPNAPITRAEFTQMISTIDNKPYGVAPFADVTGHWAERAIGSEYQAKRITGYPDGLFRPDANITRAEAAVILNKIFERKYDNLSLLKCKNPQMIKRFTDLDESFWGWNDMVEATNTHEYVRREKNKLPEDWLLIK